MITLDIAAGMALAEVAAMMIAKAAESGQAVAAVVDGIRVFAGAGSAVGDIIDQYQRTIARRSTLRISPPADEFAIDEFYPAEDRVVILPEETASTTKGGIYLPDDSRDDPRRQTGVGQVRWIGPGKMNVHVNRTMPMWAKVGMRVLYEAFGVTDVEINDVKYVVVRSDSVVGLYPSKTAVEAYGGSPLQSVPALNAEDVRLEASMRPASFPMPAADPIPTGGPVPAFVDPATMTVAEPAPPTADSGVSVPAEAPTETKAPASPAAGGAAEA